MSHTLHQQDFRLIPVQGSESLPRSPLLKKCGSAGFVLTETGVRNQNPVLFNHLRSTGNDCVICANERDFSNYNRIMHSKNYLIPLIVVIKGNWGGAMSK